MEIRAATEGDRRAVEEVAAAAIDRLADSPSVAQWGPHFRREVIAGQLTDDGHILVGGDGEDVVAVGSVRAPRRHRHHAFLTLLVAPEHRGRGLGGELYQALVELDPGPYSTRLFRSDPASLAFHERRGFTVAEICLEGVIDPAAAGVSDWIDETLAVRPDGFQVVAAHHQASVASSADIARLLDDVYIWSHEWSPPLPLSEQEAHDHYLRDRIPDTTFCAYRAHRLVGAGALTESPFREDPGRAHLVWLGVGDPRLPGAAEITRVLAAQCLRVARRLKRKVQVEASSAHPYLYQCLRGVPETALFHDLTLMVSGPPGQRQAE